MVLGLIVREGDDSSPKKKVRFRKWGTPRVSVCHALGETPGLVCDLEAVGWEAGKQEEVESPRHGASFLLLSPDSRRDK